MLFTYQVTPESWLHCCCFVDTRTNSNINKRGWLTTYFPFLSAVQFWVLFCWNNCIVVKENARIKEQYPIEPQTEQSENWLHTFL